MYSKTAVKANRVDTCVRYTTVLFELSIGISLELLVTLIYVTVETRKLVDFSYHLQIHDWGWIPFFLKEVNVWNNILELTKVDFFLDFFLFLNTVYQGT